MIRVMENPVLLITESKDQEIDRQLAKSIGAGAVVQQSRGTPIIEELWHGTIAPSELAKSEVPTRRIVDTPVEKSTINIDLINALDALTKSDDKDEDDVGGEDPAKEEMDDKGGVEDDKKEKKGEATESVKSEIEFFIDLVKADGEEKDDSTMTDAEAENAADKEANKDVDTDDADDSEKSVSSALDDLIKAAGIDEHASEIEANMNSNPVKSLPEGDLSKGTPMGVPEIKVDQYGIPLYEGVAFEVHDDADKNTVRELIDAGLVGDPEHAIDKRIPQLISRLGMIY